MNAPSGSPDVVWVESDAELLVRAGGVQVRFADGLVLVGIPVFSEETGDVEIVVAFAVGSADVPAGMVVATENAPRGPAVIVDRWGTRLVSAAYKAILQLATSVTAAAGQDVEGEPLLPAAISASRDGLVILPQARHTFDRSKPGLGS